MSKYIWNPKTKGSGIITCIPQTGECPNKCEDCFFQSGRSYLEPLDKNLPQIPSKEIADGRVVRMNDGNDSNIERDNVEQIAQCYKDYFFNTALPIKLGEFSGPVVLTVNPGKLTDDRWHKVEYTNNLMFVRIRTNVWNLYSVVKSSVEYYTKMKVPVVLTFMAYYTESIDKYFKSAYEWKKRTINSYWCLKQKYIEDIMEAYKDNPLVYSCGHKGQYSCKTCGNCLREYFATKDRMRSIKEG